MQSLEYVLGDPGIPASFPYKGLRGNVETGSNRTTSDYQGSGEERFSFNQIGSPFYFFLGGEESKKKKIGLSECSSETAFSKRSLPYVEQNILYQDSNKAVE